MGTVNEAVKTVTDLVGGTNPGSLVAVNVLPQAPGVPPQVAGAVNTATGAASNVPGAISGVTGTVSGAASNVPAAPGVLGAIGGKRRK